MDQNRSRAQLQNRFLDLVDLLLPARARRDGWGVSEGHVFRRMMLDDLFGDRWTRHLDRSLHPEQKLNDTQMSVVVGLGERLLKADAAEVEKMYRRSELWHRTRVQESGRRQVRIPQSRPRNLRPPTSVAR